MRHLFLGVASVALLTACADANVIQKAGDEQHHHHHEEKVDFKNAFQPSENVQADLDKVIARAAEQEKLVLIVMGANWCHDSRAFAKLYQNEELRELIDTEYETLLVDVGYFETIKEVITRFDMPVIYGTPTVLVVRPSDNLLINRFDMHQWRDASKINKTEAKEYFTRMASDKAILDSANQQGEYPAELQAALDEVDAFEEKQAERLYDAYAHLGPILAMKRSERPKYFNKHWDQVSKFRYGFTGDMKELRLSLIERYKMGERNLKPEFKTYPAFDFSIPEGQ